MASIYEMCRNLVIKFNESLGEEANEGIPMFKPLDLKEPGWTYMTRMDGRRYRDLGQIFPYGFDLRGKYREELYKPERFKYIPMFWEWLKSRPGAKYIGKVSDWAESTGYRDAILYKGIIFIYGGGKNNIIEYGSRSRFRDSSLWKIKKPDVEIKGDIKPSDLDKLLP